MTLLLFFSLAVGCQQNEEYQFPPQISPSKGQTQSINTSATREIEEVVNVVLPGKWVLDSEAYISANQNEAIRGAIPYDAFIRKLGGTIDDPFEDFQWAALKGKRTCDGRNLGLPFGDDEEVTYDREVERKKLMDSMLGTIIHGPYPDGGPWIFQGEYDYTIEAFPISVQMNDCSPWSKQCQHNDEVNMTRFPLLDTVPAFQDIYTNRIRTEHFVHTRNTSKVSFLWKVPPKQADSFKTDVNYPTQNLQMDIGLEITGVSYNQDCTKECFFDVQDEFVFSEDPPDPELEICLWRGFGTFFEAKLRHLVVRRDKDIIYAPVKIPPKKIYPPLVEITFVRSAAIGKGVIEGDFSFLYKERRGRKKSGKGTWIFYPGTKTISLGETALPIDTLQLQSVLYDVIKVDRTNTNETTLQNAEAKWVLRLAE